MKKNKHLHQKSAKPPFLSSNTKKNILLGCIFILLGIMGAWFLISLFYFISTDSSAFFRAFFVGLIFLLGAVLILMVVDKLTGISWLRGLSFVGERTLNIVNIVAVSVQRFCGIDIKKDNYRNADKPTVNFRKKQAKKHND